MFRKLISRDKTFEVILNTVYSYFTTNIYAEKHKFHKCIYSNNKSSPEFDAILMNYIHLLDNEKIPEQI